MNEQATFLSRVKKSSGCWDWIAGKSKGYGMFSYNGKVTGAHRWSYINFVGPIPKGKFVCHKCDNPSCVNPSHLFIGTAKDNNNDRIKKKRNAMDVGTHASLHKTTCINGHPWTDEHIKKNSKGFNYCYTCFKAAQKRRRLRINEVKIIRDALEEIYDKGSSWDGFEGYHAFEIAKKALQKIKDIK